MNLCGNGGQERPHDRKKPRRLSVKIAAFLRSKTTIYAKTLGVYTEKPHICGKKGFER